MNFSSGEGTGTAFHVTLPFAIDPTPTAVADNTADSIDLTGMQILLAEVTNSIWRSSNFSLNSTAAPSSGTGWPRSRQAFCRLAPGEIDPILMDVMMPVMNVYKATGSSGRCLRPNAKTYPYPSMSANAFQDDVQKSRAVGMNAHLPKPLSTENLLGPSRATSPKNDFILCPR